MISKAKIKLIHSLAQKKYRDETGLFAAEGPKTVGDIMRIQTPVTIAATEVWITSNRHLIPSETEVCTLTDAELTKVSFLRTPQQVIGLFRIPQTFTDTDEAKNSLILALDGVQDPGNLGTIIRIADWFGVTRIVCSTDTADAYNPKVIQATMGSIARVNVSYTNLPHFLEQTSRHSPVYGTVLGGDSIYSQQLSDTGVIVMGNEGKGISPDVERLLTRRLLIPSYPEGRQTADSLNVGVATAVTLAEFRRRKHGI